MYQIKHLFILATLAVGIATGLPSLEILGSREFCLKEHNLCAHSSDTMTFTLWFVLRLLSLETRRKACSNIRKATKISSAASNHSYLSTKMRNLAQASRFRSPNPLQSQSTVASTIPTPRSTVPRRAMSGTRNAKLIANLASSIIRTLRTAADFANAKTVTRSTNHVPLV